MHTTHLTRALACPLQIHCSSVKHGIGAASSDSELVVPACTQLHLTRRWLVHSRFTAARCSTVSALPQATIGCKARCSSMHWQSTHEHWLFHRRFTAAQRSTVSVLHRTVAVKSLFQHAHLISHRHWHVLRIHCSCSTVSVLPQATVAVVGVPACTHLISHRQCLSTADSLQLGAARYRWPQATVAVGRCSSMPQLIHAGIGVSTADSLQARCSTVSVLPQATVAGARCSSMHKLISLQALSTANSLQLVQRVSVSAASNDSGCRARCSMHTTHPHTENFWLVTADSLQLGVARYQCCLSDSGCSGRCSGMHTTHLT
jgi:hypothetical protein